MSGKPHLAIDIGASSGRHILGMLDNGRLVTEEIHRFPNSMKQINGQYSWDVDALFSEILTGIKKCADIGKIPVSVGIDTWGVDFVLLDENDTLIGPAVAYRDSRTDGMISKVGNLISDSDLYAKNGIQKIFFNTIYQLMGIKTHTPQYFDDAALLLFMPDYLHYKLCGVKKSEYTIASTSGLLNARSKNWDDDIIKRCGFPRKIFGDIIPGGTVLGGFTDEVKDAAGFDCKVVLPPSHDTACAFLAVPAKSDKSVYISSGTWSILGVEISEPVTSDESRSANFTNEGGFNYRYRFLKNIAGLWLIQSVQSEIGKDIGYTELIELARASSCDCIFDVNDERFSAPESMVDAIRDACREVVNGEMSSCGANNADAGNGGANSTAVPQTLGDFARCIFRSLANSYALTMKNLQDLTGTDYDSVNIIGGGSQNDYLNELTAEACGLPVFAGPTEGTALGNIAAQMIATGVLPDYKAARELIRNSFDIKEVKPK